MIPVQITETRYDDRPGSRTKDYNALEYSFRDLVYFLKTEFIHPSSHDVTPNSWATSDSFTDHGTRETVEHSIHLLRGIHPRYEKYWVKAFALSGILSA